MDSRDYLQNAGIPVPPKAIRIEIEYEDGTIRRATGNAASQILDWWGSCETMQNIHGNQYDGPKMQEIPPHSRTE